MALTHQFYTKLKPAVQQYLGEFISISFSQYGEDILLRDLFRTELMELDSGFYVDVGAFHPFRFSNTAFLYIMGWNGLNIDANPQGIADLKRYRRRDINVCTGVSDRVENKTFYRIGRYGAASSCSETHIKAMMENGLQFQDEIEVEMQPIDQILAQHLPENQEVHYLNIDIEGYDELVLKRWPWEQQRPKIITIEIIAPSLRAVMEHPITAFLEEKGYTCLSYYRMTAFFSL